MTQTLTQKIISSLPGIDSSVHTEVDLQTGSETSKVLYLALQSKIESMGMDFAAGTDAYPGFDEEFKEVDRLMSSSPWTLHPDHGCVLSSEVEELDKREALQEKQRA